MGMVKVSWSCSIKRSSLFRTGRERQLLGHRQVVRLCGGIHWHSYVKRLVCWLVTIMQVISPLTDGVVRSECFKLPGRTLTLKVLNPGASGTMPKTPCTIVKPGVRPRMG